jgi:hypothetical protein
MQNPYFALIGRFLASNHLNNFTNSPDEDVTDFLLGSDKSNA